MDQNECLVCDRVDSALFYKELRELSFDEKESKIVLKLMGDIYFKDVTFFAGVSRGAIKASTAYILCDILDYNGYGHYTGKHITQYDLSDKFRVSINAIRTHFKRIKAHHKDLIDQIKEEK